MTKEQFLKKYNWPPDLCPECHQITWDLIEEIHENLEESANLETVVGSSEYKVDILLEVIDRNIPDYSFLKELKQDLDKISTK